MSSIRKITHESGRVAWQARWRDPTGAQRSKNFDRRVDAERHLVATEASKLTGDYVDPRAGRIRLGDFAATAVEGWVNRRESTRARDDSYLRSLVLPTFAKMPIGVVRSVDVQRWIGRLAAQGCAPATIRKAYQLLGRIFADAVQAGTIVRSPCQGITLPTVENQEKRFLTPEEIVDLADTIDPRFRAFVVTAAYTGCRFGELAALDLDRYDPERRVIRVERSLSEVRGHLRFAQPKTPASRRAVSLPEWLPELIDDHLAAYPPGTGALVFTAPESGPIRRNSFRSRFWVPAVADSVGPPMRFHDLRHSHVALLIDHGIHPAVIAARLGHTSVKTVLDVYGHLYEGLDRGAADTLQAPWSRSHVDAMWTREPKSRDLGRDLE